MALVQRHRHVPLKLKASARLSSPPRSPSARGKLRLGSAFRQAHAVRSTTALLPFSLMVMAIMTVPTLVLDEQGLPRYRHLNAEVAELREANEELVREIAELKSEIEALRSDPSYIERIARDELGMVRDEEIVFQFPRR